MASILDDNIRLATHEQQAAIVEFAQQLVHIPSMPGQESEIATVITREMNHLGYDEVWIDQKGGNKIWLRPKL